MTTSTTEWGVFLEENSIHVIPLCGATDSRQHLVDEFCFCNPTIEAYDSGVLLVIHHEPN